MERKLTWREVFEPKTGMNQDTAFKTMVAAGYDYLAWQGAVYKLDPGTDITSARSVRVCDVRDVI